MVCICFLFLIGLSLENEQLIISAQRGLQNPLWLSLFDGHVQLWPPLTYLGWPWLVLAGHGYPWPAMACHSLPWPAMACHGRLWPVMAGLDQPWVALARRGWPASHAAMPWPPVAGHSLHCQPWLAMAWQGRPWQAVTSHGLALVCQWPAMGGHCRPWLAKAYHGDHGSERSPFGTFDGVLEDAFAGARSHRGLQLARCTRC